MTIVVLAEKPAVARDIAAVLGATKRRAGYLEGGGYRVTWALGHLVGLAEPQGINPQWARWSYATLPMLPDHWPLVVRRGVADQLAVVRRLLTARDVKEVVCATDAGREGELIFRYLYEHVGCKQPVRRLWISSLTAGAIKRGFRHLQPATHYDGLAAAARARSRADWLVGMNLSRAYSLRFDDNLSVGRVQTPTLALLVERELAILHFVPEPYREVKVTFRAPNGDYQGVYQRPSTKGTSTKGTPAKDTYAMGTSARGTTARGTSATGTTARGASAKGTSATGTTARGASAKGTSTMGTSAKGTSTTGTPAKGTSAPRRSWLPHDGALAERIARRAREGVARVKEVRRKKQRLPPPQLYDLTELQRSANRLYGMSAKHTLELAQALYEKHKLISYPRTDSRHLSSDIAATLPAVVQAVAPAYGDHVPAAALAAKPLSKRFVNDSKVSDHHAIIPTTSRCRLSPNSDVFKVYDLVCRRFLQAWCDDYVEAVTRVVTTIFGTENEAGKTTPFEDHYRSRGSSIEQPGWKVLEATSRRAPRKKPDLPAGLKPQLPVEVINSKILNRTTKPPLPFTDATLLTAMETAGRTLDEKKLSDAMRDCGLGTPATRATTIESLLSRQYLSREGKGLRATDKGIDLIARVHKHVRSPAMTGSWEARLKAMQRGETSFETFMTDIEAFVREVVGDVKNSGPAGSGGYTRYQRASNGATSTATATAATNTATPSSSDSELVAAAPPRPYAPTPRSAAHSPQRASHRPTAARQQAPPTHRHHNIDPCERTSTTTANRTTPAVKQPVGRAGLKRLLAERFGFDSFRPHQFDICAAVTEGHDALVVMPTGAGKSLCYQLPGLARAGCTLVISPLVALIEDQVQKLQHMGLNADCIHAGRDRMTSRQVCRDYLAGKLDYFFIAPERLAVRGFPQMLAKRPPALIAIDEAHCISDWGHDFRPDYRMLQQRLQVLRTLPQPPPIVALTATATPRVQQDIGKQLGLHKTDQFIFGFRRHNIGIEVVEVPVPSRPALALKLLLDNNRVPAIVYSPTRKKTESLARTLGKKLRAGAYHAGMSADKRDNVQRAFSAGELDVVVATVAFGMGIDKANVRTVIHTALPGSIEAYYQEIGRAGRDGRPSRAILMHSFADVRMLDFFLDRDYPPSANLRRVYKALSDTPRARDILSYEVTGKPQDVARWIDKLWVAGGAHINDHGEVTRGARHWKAPYEKQRQHKQAQIDAVQAFVRANVCRMNALINHFGDRADSGQPCGSCDICAPEQSLLLASHEPNADELVVLQTIIEALRQYDGQASGRMHRELAPPDCDRASFERLISALARANIVEVRVDTFEKDNKEIVFHRVDLIDDAVTAAELCARVVLLTSPCPAPASPSKPSTVGRGRGRRRGRYKGDDARRRDMNHTRNYKGRRGKKGGWRSKRKGRQSRGSSSRGSANKRAAVGSVLDNIAAPRATVEALLSWRVETARRHQMPASRILTDKQLGAVAMVAPSDERELADVYGIGPKTLKLWSEGILDTLRQC